MVDIKVLISTFFSLVIYRQYGVKGAATKRSNTKSSIIIDFEIFQQMTDPSFIKNLKEKTESFLQQLAEHQKSGRTPY
jgi:hypothetical protein